MARGSRTSLFALLLAVLGFSSGCHSCGGTDLPVANQLPRELEKTTLPSYVIEPPDELVINVIRVTPKPPYRIDALDMLLLQVPVTSVKPNEQITGLYQVDAEGNLSMGLAYGMVRVLGMTIEEAKVAITEYLDKHAGVKDPKVSLALAQGKPMEVIRGAHLVRSDGTVSLGTYGEVRVAGLTIVQARAEIQRHLAQYLSNPEVTVDISGYNTKTYFVIFDGAGFGEQIFERPITGNETVIKALAGVGGLPPSASKKHIWIARPAPAGSGGMQILPIDYVGITERAETVTDYQLFPGDRVYVQADWLVTANNVLTKILSPVERVLSITLLGNSTIKSFQSNTGSSGP